MNKWIDIEDIFFFIIPILILGCIFAIMKPIFSGLFREVFPINDLIGDVDVSNDLIIGENKIIIEEVIEEPRIEYRIDRGVYINENCMVCRLAILSNDKTETCPNCGNIAHSSHLKEWIKIKGKCPMCKESI